MRNSRSPFFTSCPSVNVRSLDEAGHPRDDVDLVDRDDAADEFAVSVTSRLATGATVTAGGGGACCAKAAPHKAAPQRISTTTGTMNALNLGLMLNPRIGCSCRCAQICTNFCGLSPGRGACAPRANRFAQSRFTIFSHCPRMGHAKILQRGGRSRRQLASVSFGADACATITSAGLTTLPSPFMSPRPASPGRPKRAARKSMKVLVLADGLRLG